MEYENVARYAFRHTRDAMLYGWRARGPVRRRAMARYYMEAEKAWVKKVKELARRADTIWAADAAR